MCIHVHVVGSDWPIPLLSSRCYLHVCSCTQLVQVCGNLKVKLSPEKTTSSGVMEVSEPLVVGFVGECHIIESVPSILEFSVPCSSFVVTRSADMKKVISIDAT